METNEEGNSFIIIKDHKENFDNHSTISPARLINPAKNELGRIRKLILDKINKKISQKFELNQWKNTDVVIDWFKQIKTYINLRLLILKNFIRLLECLLKSAINFPEQHAETSEKDKAIIFHARKSLLFNGQQVWIKKKGGLFDVTMGAFDGAEVCEAIDNFLLYQLLKNYNKKDIGLYRDDRLAIFKIVNGSKAEKNLKRYTKII